MKYIFLAALLFSCARHYDKKPLPTTFEDVKARRDFYVSQLKDPHGRIARCDGLTFYGLYDAATRGHFTDIYRHEYDVDILGNKTHKTGQIHRDVELCYSTVLGSVGSRSECSPENVLSWFHAMHSRGDTDAILRTIRRARASDWRFCEGGPDEYVQIKQLAPLLNDWEKKIAGTPPVQTLHGLTEVSFDLPTLDTFRGNVLGSYILLKGRVFGYLRGAEISALKELLKLVPHSPIYQAALHRFTDSDFSKAVEIMTGPEFPLDSLPVDEDDHLFNWNGHAAGMLYVWATAIIEGV